MFNIEKIKDNFFGLVGLRQTESPDFPTLNSKLLYTGSNLLVEHPLLNIENIDLCARNYSLFNYPAWSNITVYQLGERVKFSNIVYESKANGNTGNQPDTSPNDWEVVNLLSLYLEDIFASGFVDTVNQVMVEKRINNITKTLLSNVRLSDGAGNMKNLIVNQGDLVGVKLTLKYGENILAVINRIGLQLTQANPNLVIYVYHTSNYEPIATVNLNHSKVLTIQWHNVDIKLNYISETTDAGGSFFIMYDQNALIGQAVKKEDAFSAPCGTCMGSTGLQTYNLYRRYIAVEPCRVKSADRDGVNLWDIEKTAYEPSNNFGFNFEMTVRCDLTDFIIRQRDVFAFACRDMIKIKLLKNLMLSTRQNSVSAKMDDRDKANSIVRAELTGRKEGGMGLQEDLTRQLKAVEFELSNLDDTCMPCNRKYGLSFSTAGLA